MTSSPSEPAAVKARAVRRDCVYIALASLLPLMILRPLQDVPFVDDWAYAWSVENLLTTGRVQVLDFSSNLNIAHVLWGWLFCLPFGFSFTALRLSTWVMSVVCLCGLYLTLRELSIPRRASLFGTAVLALYPVYFLLTFTFMTDVPFLAAVVWSSFCLVRAVNHQSDRWLVAGALLACVTISVRVLGVVLPAVYLATLLFHTGRWGRRPVRLLIACLPALCAAGLTWVYPDFIAHRADMSELGGSPARRGQYLLSGLIFLPVLYVMNLGLAAGSVGLALAPLAVGIAGTVERKRSARIAALLLLLLVAQVAVGLSVYHALHEDFFWNAHELGLAERMTPDFPSRGPVPMWIWAVHVVAVGSSAVILTAAGRANAGAASKALGWLVGGSFLLLTAVWAFYDRYLLLLIPALIVLVLTNRKLSHPKTAMALLAVFGMLSFVGVRDHLTFNAALWKAVSYLDNEGAPKHEIHGGYVINCWFLYAHSENARLDDEGHVLIPGMTTEEPVRYKISNQPMPGARVLFEAPYERWLGRSGAVYVLDLEAQTGESEDGTGMVN